MCKTRWSKKTQREAGGLGKQWKERQESLELSQSRRDTWEGGQKWASAVSLWSVRYFTEFTDSLYFLLAVVHLMRARDGKGTRRER